MADVILFSLIIMLIISFLPRNILLDDYICVHCHIFYMMVTNFTMKCCNNDQTL